MSKKITEVIDFNKTPLIPAIAQDWHSREILMLAYMDEEALRRSLEEKIAYYYSRSRKKLWKKGESSGHIQKIKEIFLDCDEDAIVLLVEQVGGAACHTGYNSCFYRSLELREGEIQLNVIKQEKVFDPDKVYGPGKTADH